MTGSMVGFGTGVPRYGLVDGRPVLVPPQSPAAPPPDPQQLQPVPAPSFSLVSSAQAAPAPAAPDPLKDPAFLAEARKRGYDVPAGQSWHDVPDELAAQLNAGTFKPGQPATAPPGAKPSWESVPDELAAQLNAGTFKPGAPDPSQDPAFLAEARKRGYDVPDPVSANGQPTGWAHDLPFLKESALNIGANIAGTPSAMAQGVINAAWPPAWTGAGQAPDIVPGQPAALKQRMKDAGWTGDPAAEPQGEPERVFQKGIEGFGSGATGGFGGALLGGFGGMTGELARRAYQGTPHEQFAEGVGNLLPSIVTMAAPSVSRSAAGIAGTKAAIDRDVAGKVNSAAGIKEPSANPFRPSEPPAAAQVNLDAYNAAPTNATVPGFRMTTAQAMQSPGVQALADANKTAMAPGLEDLTAGNAAAARIAFAGAQPVVPPTQTPAATQAAVQDAVGKLPAGITTAEQAGASVRKGLQARRQELADARVTATQAGFQAGDAATVPRQGVQAVSDGISKALSGMAADDPAAGVLSRLRGALARTYTPDRQVPSAIVGPNGRPIMTTVPGKDAVGKPLIDEVKALSSGLDRQTAVVVTPYFQQVRDLVGQQEPAFAASRSTYRTMSAPINAVDADKTGAYLKTTGTPFGPQDPRMSNSAIVNDLMSRTEGTQAMEQLLRAHGGNRPAALDDLADHVVQRMRSGPTPAINPDNTVNVPAMARFRSQNQAMLANFRDVSGKAMNAETLQNLANRAQQRGALLDKFQQGPLAEGVPFDPAKVGKFLDRNQNDIVNLFGQQHLDNMRKVVQEVTPQDLSGGTVAAQGKIERMRAAAGKLVQHKLADAIMTVAGGAVGLHTEGGLLGLAGGAALGEGGKYLAHAMTAKRNMLTSQLLSDVLLDPAKAAALTQRVNRMNAPMVNNSLAVMMPYVFAQQAQQKQPAGQ